MPQIITTICAALPQIITSIIDTLTSHIGEIIDCGVKLFVALIENLPTIIVEIVKAVPEIIAALVKAIAEGIPEMAKSGTELVKGLFNGIKDAGSWLYGKLQGWVSDVLSWIKGLFGIHSPSRETAEDGKYLAMGLGKGITDNVKYATDAVKQMGEAVESSFNPKLEIPKVENDMGLSAVNLDATAHITPTFTDSVGLEVERENKLEMALQNSNADVISTLVQITQQLISTIEDIDNSVTIGDDVIANAAARGNKNYKRRTGKPLFA